MWEKISTKTMEEKGSHNRVCCESDRLKVPGGWIVRSIAGSTFRPGMMVVQTFVSDSDYSWKFE